MQYERIIIRSLSRHPSSTNSADAIYQFDNPLLLEGKRLKLLYFTSYNTKLTIDSTNNKIDFNENSTNKTATLTQGYYTAASLATELATQLTSASGGWNTYTVTYSAITRKITVAASNAFTLLFLTGANTSTAPFRELGFISSNGLTAVDSSTATSVTGSFPVNLSLPLSFYIDINEFGNYDNKTSDGQSFCFYIPNNAASGSVVEYKNDSIEQIITVPPNLRFIQRLTVKIYHGNRQQINLQGSEYEMVLQIL